jgi:signal transduction histidine kinase/DNA-binding response OmpR family regulator
MERERILVVEDEEVIRHVLSSFLDEMNCDVEAAESAEDALVLLGNSTFGAALVDIVLPGMNGIDFLKKLKALSPDTEVIIMTSHASVDTATQAIRSGAYDYLLKPFEEIDEVWETVKRALERRHLTLSNRQLVQDLELRNQQLSEAVKRRDSQVEAGRAMSGIYELSELLDFLVGLLSRELSAERVSLMLLEEPNKELFIAASRGIPEQVISKTRVKLGEGVAGKVAKSGQAVLVKDAKNEGQVIAEARPDQSASFISAPILLSIPIKSQDRVLGVINVTDRQSGTSFSEDDVAYIEGLAGHMAVAIERTKHLGALRRAHDDLEERVRSRTQELEKAKEAAEKAVKARDAFLANVSHELRTPMHAILSFATFGRDRVDSSAPEKLKNFFGKIHTSGTRLLGLLNDLLDLSKLEAGRMVFDFGDCDLVHVVEAVVDELGLLTSERNLDVHVAKSGVTRVTADPERMIQVMRNMLDNAIKFSPEGGSIEIDVCGGDGEVAVSVTDKGSGIQEAELESIFDAFVQSGTVKSGSGGTGLGLAICKDIIKAHGGRIWAESNPDGGAVFRFTVPSELATSEGDGSQIAA